MVVLVEVKEVVAKVVGVSVAEMEEVKEVVV